MKRLLWFAADFVFAAIIIAAVWVVNYLIPQKGVNPYMDFTGRVQIVQLVLYVSVPVSAGMRAYAARKTMKHN